MKKILVTIPAFLILFLPKMTFAVCPVCTVAVGAGLGLAEWLGIDDSISGLWIGALIISMSIWTINWLNVKSLALRNPDVTSGGEKPSFGKNIRDIFIFLIYYAIVILPLWWKGKIGHPYNKFCGIDKLLFGIILGTILFFSGVILHNYLRKGNESKSYFKGQKIVLAVAPIIIASIILYFTC
ncbi:MAG: hypothetical protein A3J76_05065 [Candidatus Moranbacteria bacterium RBG_13_45_13]|nr:MAG: hypothetical protein A3J76_05065 [Candidatus Moranbacteria bacterium RBG_13_45_13]